jgi:hypothetical protein
VITEPRKPDPLTCALVGSLLTSSSLAWRHHGIGLLQAYVVQGPTEYRLHVWHPELRFVDEDSGMIHDHRFHLESRVLLGAIHDAEILLHPHDRGWIVPRPIYQVWEVENARKAAASGDGWVRKVEWGEPATVLDRAPLCTIDTLDHVYSMGSRYAYPPRRFHRSTVEELTVTVCTKTLQQDVPARILAREGKTPKHGIGEPLVVGWGSGLQGSDPREKYLHEASEKLLEMVRSG